MTTFAGTDWLFPGDGRPALQAPLGGLLSLDVVVDRNGNYYIADADNSVILRVGADGIANVIAGNGLLGLSGDGGLAVNASLDIPLCVAVDFAGNVYIGEFGGRVRKVTPDGIINTIAGTDTSGYSGDGGPATSAQLDQPFGLAVDSAGNVYIADSNNHRVRRVSPNGIITTVAGTGEIGFSGDRGPATAAKLNMPTRIAVDGSGNLFIVETINARIRKVSGGVIDTFAGGGLNPGENIAATSAAMFPLAVATDSAGNVYLVDSTTFSVRKIDTQGRIRTIAGAGISGFSGDGGPALNARFNFLLFSGLAVDSLGSVFVGDDQNRRVRKITPDGRIQTIAGNGLYRFSGDGGPATSATLYLPISVLADVAGNVYITETGQNRIRRVARDGTISVFAGTGAQGYSGDNGPATSANLSFPTYLIGDGAGNIYFSDTLNQVIRRIDSKGAITTVVGNGNADFAGDGLAPRQASFRSPYGIAFDDAGELLIADSNNHRLRLVDSAGKVIFTLAGTGEAGFAGDGGRSTQAKLNTPIGITYFNGAVYFCDSKNNRVRRIDASTLTITTIAGNGKAGYSGDGGQALQASLKNPQGLGFDNAGNLYIADQGNFVVRKVAPNGIITTFAGSPGAGTAGDGNLATKAVLGGPTDITLDLAGNILIADFASSLVREVLAAAPTFQVSTTNLQFTAPAGSTAVDQSVDVSGSIPGIPYAATVSASAPWITVSPVSGTMPASVRVSVDPSKLAAGSNQGTVTIASAVTKPAALAISVRLTTTAAGQPSLNLKPTSLNFAFVQQSAARIRTLTISNVGGGSLPVNIVAATNSGGAWLKTSATTATAAAFGSTSITLTIDPTNLAAGTYSGTVTASSVNPAQSVTVPVTITVSAVLQSILIPQTGLTFFAVQGGGPAAPQFFHILNTGRGQMRWSTRASTLSGGSWLSAFPTNGLSDADSPLVPSVRLDVDPQGLAAGTYSGTVQVTAPDADNTPQFVSVFLNVLRPGSNIGPVVQPSAMIFSAVAGRESPGSQTILVQSLNSAPVTFRSGAVTADGRNWITVAPREGTVTAAQPARIVVQPVIEGLGPGIYRATLTLSFSDGNTRNIAIVLVIAPTGSARGSGGLVQAIGGCTATALVPVFTLLFDGFSASVGYPGQVAVKVIDDCGNPMITGNVTVSFSNGDAPVRLTSLKDGTFAGTWTPQRTTTSVTVTADAEIPEQRIKGSVKVQGSFLTLDTPPVIGDGAVVNAASFAQQAPLAPGSLITIFGSKLAQGQAAASTIPLPTSLGGSSVVVAGIQTPLTFANEGQVNAMVPYDVAVNIPQQVIVTRGANYSAPQSITVAAAAPGVFTRDGSGGGQGLVFKVDSTGTQTLADAAHPVRAGDVVVIYCTGLGKVAPPVIAGSPAPDAPVSNTVNPVIVKVGGVDVTPFFAGLTPRFAGLYQINLVIPPGVTPGDQVPVVITEAGQSGRAVVIAVR